MKTFAFHRRFIALVAAWLTLTAVSWAADTVKLVKGSLQGHVVNMTPDHVELETGADKNRQIAVSTIKTISFEGEPTELKIAKTHAISGHYAEAAAALARIDRDLARPEVQQDFEFYKALCAGKIAPAAGNTLADAAAALKQFLEAHPNNYHYYEVCETLGDVLCADNRPKEAIGYYERLHQAPWPDYRMRAGVAIGRALLSQRQVAEAQAAFDRVIAVEADSDAAQAQRLQARLGQAAARVAAGKPDDAVKIVENLLKSIDPQEAAIAAQAYNVLGAAYRKAGRPQEALLAYLSVDHLYAAVPEAHAEALANLVELWEQVGHQDRAELARKTLLEKYPTSPWSRNLPTR
ncbi:MAG: tetratricopeptide repeat protein [Thermoguttaceae bacterium]